jgi:hypothetical protein
MAIGFNEIQVEETALGEIVILVIKGKLSKEDYDAFVPQLDWLIEKKEPSSCLLNWLIFRVGQPAHCGKIPNLRLSICGTSASWRWWEKEGNGKKG